MAAILVLYMHVNDVPIVSFMQKLDAIDEYSEPLPSGS